MNTKRQTETDRNKQDRDRGWTNNVRIIVYIMAQSTGAKHSKHGSKNLVRFSIFDRIFVALTILSELVSVLTCNIDEKLCNISTTILDWSG